MSLLKFMKPENEIVQGEKFDNEFSDLGDVTETSYYDGVYNENTDADFNRYSKVVNDLSETYFKFDPVNETLLSENEQQIRKQFRSLTLKSHVGSVKKHSAKDLIKQYKLLRPDLNDIPDIDALAIQVGKDASKSAQDALSSGPFGSTPASFAGGLASAGVDPVEWMLALLPVGKAHSVLKAFAVGATENLAAEALNTPNKIALRKSIGEELTTKQVAQNLVASATLGGLVSATPAAISKLRGKKKLSKVVEGVDEDSNPGNALEIVDPKDIEGTPRKVEGEVIDADRGPELDSDPTIVETSSRRIEDGPILQPSKSSEDFTDFSRPDLSKEYDDLLRRTDLPDEVRDAVIILKKQANDIRNKPPGVPIHQHLAAVAEIDAAIARGAIPDFDSINRAFGFDDPEFKNRNKIEDVEVDEIPDGNEDFVVAEPDNRTSEQIVRDSETGKSQFDSPEKARTAREDLEKIANDDPDATFEVDGEELTIKEVLDLVDENDKALDALEFCRI